MALPACSKAAMKAVRHITSAALVLTHGLGAVARVAVATHGWELIREPQTDIQAASIKWPLCGAEMLLLAPHPPHEINLTAQSQRTGGRP